MLMCSQFGPGRRPIVLCIKQDPKESVWVFETQVCYFVRVKACCCACKASATIAKEFICRIAKLTFCHYPRASIPHLQLWSDT